MNMSTAQARVIDPILSTHAQGYTNAEMIGHRLFPVVTIPVRGMKVIKFNKDSFRKLNTRRAPGTRSKRVQYGYASNPVALIQDALEGVVPIEHMQDAAKVPGLDLGKGAINQVLDIIGLGREFEIASKVRNPANYAANNKVALSGASKWSDDASDPEGDIKDAREQIRARTGRYPNILEIGAKTFTRLTRHPKIVERFKFTSDKSITAAMLAGLFEVDEIVVGKAVYLDENDSDDADAKDVWGNDAVLAYVSKGDDYRVPSFGYTYRLLGSPAVEKPYFERPEKSWIYPTTEDWSPEMTATDAGFLFQNPI